MTMNIRASSLVTLLMPDTQYPPVQTTLAQVRVGLLQGRIPPTAVLQVSPNGEWLPVQPVIAECIDFQPTRAGLVMALMGVAPLALLLVHIALFGSAGVVGPVVLLAAGVTGLVVVGSTPSLRTRPGGALLRAPAFMATVGIVLLACEAPALVLGFIDHRKHAQIATALSSANPCDVEGVSQIVQDDGTDGEKSVAQSRQSQCEAERYKQGCARLIAHVDGNAVTGDDLTWLGAHGSVKDADVVPRLAKKTLGYRDLGLTPGDLSCNDRIWDRVVRALAATPTVWTTDIQPSTDMVSALSTVGLSLDSQAALRARAEAMAPSFAKKAKSEEMSPGASTCELCSKLRMSTGPACTALVERYTRLVAREQTAAAAKAKLQGAVDEAKAARCEALEVARNRCLDPCMDIDLFDPRADACEARCKARFPSTGCE